MTRHIHLVGSINLPSAAESMETATAIMGDNLLRLPDGEPGPRRRIEVASRYVKAFGVATECGIGRMESSENVRRLFDIHMAVAE